MSVALPPVFWPILLGILGVVFGSFIATVAIRWLAGRSALSGRSGCDGCGRTLTAAELVPLVSFVALRGRCRTCGAAIAPGHAVTELLGGGIGVVAGLVAPGWEGLAGAGCGWLLLALGAIGLWLGWRALPQVLLIAALAGLAIALLLRLTGRRVTATDRMPLGTLLAGAAFLCWAV